MSKAVEIIRQEIENGNIKSADEGDAMLRTLAATLSVDILFNAISTKHPAYQTEREVRLIMVTDASHAGPITATRPSGSRLVPFVKIDMPIRAPGNVSEIVIGPAADGEAEHAVKSMLNRFGLASGIQVRRSTIPYRSRR